jgi:hypothetical protein
MIDKKHKQSQINFIDDEIKKINEVSQKKIKDLIKWNN